MNLSKTMYYFLVLYKLFADDKEEHGTIAVESDLVDDYKSTAIKNIVMDQKRKELPDAKKIFLIIVKIEKITQIRYSMHRNKLKKA